MKRFLLFFLTVIFCFSFTACGSSKQSYEGDHSTQKVSDDIFTTLKPINTNEEKNYSDSFSQINKIVGRSLFINYNSSRRTFSQSNTIVYYNNNSDVISLAYDFDENILFSGTAREALDYLNDGRIFRAIDTHGDAYFSKNGMIYKIDFSSIEDKAIKDINSVVFYGSVTDDEGIKCYIYGYAFVLENTAFILSGVDTSRQQREEIKNSIIEEIDGMIMTVRNER